MDKKHFANKLGKNASENSSLLNQIKVDLSYSHPKSDVFKI